MRLLLFLATISLVMLGDVQGQLTEPYRKQFHSYQERAEKGDVWAQGKVGFCYAVGQGVETNYTEAVRWYRVAAERGDGWAQGALGWCYRYGKGVDTNYTEALVWFRKAASQNNGWGRYQLGLCYWYGQGVPADRAEANKHFKMAGNLDYAPAFRMVGDYYAYTVTNYFAAAEWYRKAALHNDAPAQFYLSELYRDGLGVKTNYVEAGAWAGIAASTDGRAARLWEALQHTMSPEQISDAKKQMGELRGQITGP